MTWLAGVGQVLLPSPYRLTDWLLSLVMARPVPLPSCATGTVTCTRLIAPLVPALPFRVPLLPLKAPLPTCRNRRRLPEVMVSDQACAVAISARHSTARQVLAARRVWLERVVVRFMVSGMTVVVRKKPGAGNGDGGSLCANP